MIGCCFLVRPVILPSRPVTLRTLPLTMNSEVHASGLCLGQHQVAAANACYCRATDRTRPVLIGPRPVTSVELVLRDLVSSLVPIFVLGLCLISWVFSCASRVLLMVLIVGSSCHLRPSHVLHPIELQKQFLVNSLVQFGCVGHQAPKSKVNGPRVYFPYNLPLFGD